MFFETTYVPSPTLSATSVDDDRVEDVPSDLDQQTHSPGASSAKPAQPADSPQNSSDFRPDSDRPVDHLIFVIHGIGQQTEQYGHFYEHIENLQETTRQVLQVKIPDHNIRIELIPIEWHRHIHDQVDPILNKITLKSIPTIRLIENDYLADVLFYFSKDRGQNIIDNITQLFNTSYRNFVEKHPNFNGKIIILGYSLGGIITWDILSHQREEEMHALTEEERANYNKLDIKYPKLEFKPHYFFSLGSPISAVLTFRGQDPNFYHPNFDTIQFENIFHPFDPLGYRFEPLFNDYFTDKPAVLVERSVPIGPSFSFPSMWSSFPLSSAGFFSFFSWKPQQQSEDKVAKTLYNATSDTAEAMNYQQTDDNSLLDEELRKSDNDEMVNSDHQSSAGFMNSLLQYFTKGGARSKKKNTSTVTSVSSPVPTAFESGSPHDECITIGDDEDAPWDPVLREQTRQQLLALRDDLDRTLKTMNGPYASASTVAPSSTSTSVSPSRRPSLGARPKSSLAATRLYSSSLDNASDGSLMLAGKLADGKGSMEEADDYDNDAMLKEEQKKSNTNSELDGISDSIKRLPLKKTFTTGTHDHPIKRRQQLVEILGTDGMKLHLNYDRKLMDRSSNSQEEQQTTALPTKPDSDGQNTQTSKQALQHQQGLQKKYGNEDEEVIVEGKDEVGDKNEEIQSSNTNATENTNIDSNGSSNTAQDNQTNTTEAQSGSGNIWKDLNLEMKKPGPAITNPGESKADVAQDSTLPKSNPETNAKEEQKETDVDEENRQAASSLPGGSRIDYVLQPESVMSMIANEYLIGLRAHFSYWTNKDFIWHMLRRIDSNLQNIALEVEAEKKLSKKEKQERKKRRRNSSTPTSFSGSPAMTVVATDEAEEAIKDKGSNDEFYANKAVDKSSMDKKKANSQKPIISIDNTHMEEKK